MFRFNFIHLVFVLICALTANTLAHADSEEKAMAGRNNVSGLLSLQNGASPGFQYENLINDARGLGATVRIFPKETSSLNPQNGYTVLGMFSSFHFYKKNWDLSFSPGVAAINIDPTNSSRSDSLTFGPSLAFGVMIPTSAHLSVGFENTRYWVWSHTDYRGLRIDDFAIKARGTF